MSNRGRNKISVVTIVRNDPDGLRKTLASVSVQDEHPFEHLIIDGASTDGETLEAASEYVETYTFAKLHSEKDSGISDALNKGARMATGDFVIYMNAGDVFYSAQSFKSLVEIITKYDSPFVLYGQAELVYPNFTTKMKQRNHRSFDSIFQFWNPICHQATVVSRELLLKYPFREGLKYSMDLEFWMHLLKDRVQFHQTALVCCKYEMGGVSSDPRNIPAVIKEHLKVYLESGRWYKKIPALGVQLRYWAEKFGGPFLQHVINYARERRNR